MTRSKRVSEIKPQEIADISRQLAAFLRAGIPIIEAVEVMALDASSGTRALLTSIGVRLREGDSLSEVFAANAKSLPSYYPGIIRSAELSGRLDIVLDQLANYIDRDQETRRRMKSALTYPAILGGLSVITVVVLVGFVLPKFETFFVGLDAELPMSTTLLLGLGRSAKAHGIHAVTAMSLTMLALALFLRTGAGRLLRDRVLLRVPVVKGIVQAAVVERFCRILSTMVRGGIPIADGMTAAIESSDNLVYERSLKTAAREMLEGAGFAGPIAGTTLFPRMVTQMMRVGEDTGTLDHQLEVAATYYERELGHRLQRLTSLFEPAVIVAMGLVVGFVAVALVQAMYGVYSQAGT